MKICKLCGKEFEPTTNAQRICKDIHYRSCEVCGTQFVITRPSASQLCCSKECTQKKREATMIERHGVAHALQNKELLKKAENTTLERFGVKHAAQSDEVKQKVREHFNEKYGVNTPFQMDDFWDKAKQTNLEKYGTEYAIQSESVQKKSELTCEEKYGTKHSIQSDSVKATIERICLEKYGVPYPCMTDQCRESSAAVISKTNKAIADKLNSAGLVCELDKIKLNRFSYDIHILDTNILLEIDPTYTHNSIGNHWDKNGMDKCYHLNKTKLAAANGYRCIHIFDWDDLDKVIQLLVSKKTIYARKCAVADIDYNTAGKFEMQYHLQGDCRGQQVCLGLYYEGELVEVMTFGKPRYNKKYQWELLRLCTHSDYKVTGGASKLFSYFIREYKPESIISYCDLAKFDGRVYEQLGFHHVKYTEPQKVWSKGSEKITDNLLRQRGFDQLFSANYGKGTNNEELMLQHGWLPVYDCGQAVYAYLI